MARHDFHDDKGELCFLVIDETPAGEHGVEHPGCTELALVIVLNDSYACAACSRVGRVDSAWAMQLWRAEATLTGGA